MTDIVTANKNCGNKHYQERRGKEGKCVRFIAQQAGVGDSSESGNEGVDTGQETADGIKAGHGK